MYSDVPNTESIFDCPEIWSYHSMENTNTEKLQSENLDLHSKNIALYEQNRELCAYAMCLEKEIRRLNETPPSPPEGVINFSLGGKRFSAKLDNNIHFSPLGVIDNKCVMAVAQVDTPRHENNGSEIVTFLGNMHSIVQVGGGN